MTHIKGHLVKVAALFLFFTIQFTAYCDLAIHFIDVGQGDAILLKTEHHTVLIDAGPANGRVLNYLSTIGVNRIDLAVATHAHADHIGGFTEILSRLPVTEIWYNGQTHTTRSFELFIDLLLSSDTIYREPVRGYQRQLEQLVLEVLHPPSSAADYTGHLHDMNMVVRARYGSGFAVLLTGDLEVAGEQQLIEAGLDLRADVLKLAHHGSSTSTSPAFLQAVQPTLAVYQASAGNRYGHPHDAIIARLIRLGVLVKGTAVDGAIIIDTDGETFSLRSGSGHAAISSTTAAVSSTAAATSVCVDLNRASATQLQRIVHIGPQRALEIIELRPFKTVGDLQRLAGIGQQRLGDILSQGLACVLDGP